MTQLILRFEYATVLRSIFCEAELFGHVLRSLRLLPSLSQRLTAREWP
jgi:hypothetical protein